MMTPEQNEFLTRVGPGTPAGDMLRRYWHPVAAAGELTAEKPIKEVRILGEDLIVFRMPPAEGQSQPSYGLVGKHCPHRRASFTYGKVDQQGIRCPYHGWKFNAAGRCLEQPAEPANSTYKDRIQHTAYPVQKLAGLLFAYMGPAPAPLLPRWDVLAREDGRRWGVVESVINCNWLQAMENSVDPAHLYWLHGTLGSPNMPVSAERFSALGLQPEYEEKNEFFRFDYGIQKRRTTQGNRPGDPPLLEQHPLVFPTSLAPDAHAQFSAQARLPARAAFYRGGNEARLPAQHANTPSDRRHAHPAIPGELSCRRSTTRSDPDRGRRAVRVLRPQDPAGRLQHEFGDGPGRTCVGIARRTDRPLAGTSRRLGSRHRDAAQVAEGADRARARWQGTDRYRPRPAKEQGRSISTPSMRLSGCTAARRRLRKPPMFLKENGFENHNDLIRGCGRNFCSGAVRC